LANADVIAINITACNSAQRALALREAWRFSYICGNAVGATCQLCGWLRDKCASLTSVDSKVRTKRRRLCLHCRKQTTCIHW